MTYMYMYMHVATFFRSWSCGKLYLGFIIQYLPLSSIELEVYRNQINTVPNYH